MSTRYQFVDDSGETRLAGFLEPDPGGASPSVVKFSLSSAEFLALHATSLQKLAAPGVGKANVPLLGTFAYHLGTNPYADGGSVQFGPTPTVDDGQCLRVCTANAITNAATDILVPDLGDGIFDLTNYVNVPLSVGVTAQEFTGGNGTFSIAIVYVTIDVPT